MSQAHDLPGQSDEQTQESDRKGMHPFSQLLRWFGRNAKRGFILLFGVAVLSAGVLMLVLPGPGVIVVILGLVILATEFAWAERALDSAATRAADATTKVQDSTAGMWSLALSGLGMVAGGVAVAIIWPEFIVVGVSVAVAGVIGLATLHPKAREWIAERASEDA